LFRFIHVVWFSYIQLKMEQDALGHEPLKLSILTLTTSGLRGISMPVLSLQVRNRYQNAVVSIWCGEHGIGFFLACFVHEHMVFVQLARGENRLVHTYIYLYQPSIPCKSPVTIDIFCMWWINRTTTLAAVNNCKLSVILIVSANT
jgi:hypothetical protein